MLHKPLSYKSKLSWTLLVLALGIIAGGFVFFKHKILILNQIEDLFKSDRLISSLDFESSNLSGWSTEDLCCKHSFERVQFPRRAGQYAAKFTITKDDELRSDGLRAELKRYGLFTLGSERWYGFSMFLPDDYVADEQSLEILTQWHDLPDFILGEEWRSPPLSLVTHNGKWFIVQKWDSNKITTDDGKEVGKRMIDVGSYTTGTWTDWVFHVKWSSQSDGFLKVWKNGKLIINQSGPTTYNDLVGPYFKIGIYPNWISTPSKINKRVLYVDQIRIGGSKANYEDVKPR